MSNNDQRFDDLAAYLAQLLDLLHDNEPPSAEAIRKAAGPYSHALGELDADLIDIAAELTKTWGRLRPDSGIQE